ncbi:hypothetical protein [Bradyrhizobium sp. 35]|uniref:hypothetical protein n=1 Tax=Bradyrhizobium sp. 35 TaxID=2782670 RepID=UPI001FFB9E32|nr:hypothetical protein [Bradyrhizobium sp. 35]
MPRPISSGGFAAITAALERINAHVMRRIGVSRGKLFGTVERPVLAPLRDAEN